MNGQEALTSQETVCWEGRPAPRCYTFRNWRHSIFGVVLLLIAIYWQKVGVQVAAEYELPWLSWLPVPFLLLGLYLSVGHLLLARFEWGRVCYQITDNRILVSRGLLKPRNESMSLALVTYFCLNPHGEELGSIRIHAGDTALTLKCVEYPRQVTDLLEQAMGDKARPVPEP